MTAAPAVDAPPSRIDGRWTAAAGLASVAVLVVAAAVLGHAPAADDSAASVLADTAAHRTRLLLGVTTVGLGLGLSLAFVAGLWAHVRRNQRSAFWPATALGAAIAVFATAASGVAVVGAVAYRSPAVAPETARVLWDLYGASLDVSNALTVVMALAFAAALVSDPVLPRWTGAASVLIAVLHLAASWCWARSGFWSPTGTVAQVPAFAYLAWVAAISVSLLRPAAPGRRARVGTEVPAPLR